ncbi:MAG: hypothetical protein P4L71_15220 [Acetobacteraceae bacterium]|nr:hypothetical protein [Acetobacteraceae bacterium]
MPAVAAMDLPAGIKRGSVTRRVVPAGGLRCVPQPGFEGDVAAFLLPPEAAPVTIEATTGRAMVLAPGDLFLGAPGYRESTRWVVGSVPDGGLQPGSDYWILADCGIVGTLLGDSPREKGHLAQVRFLGTVQDATGETLTLRRFALPPPEGPQQQAPVFLVVGTASEVGKTTAALSVLRALRRSGRQRVLALKATGTSSLTELHSYLDYGAAPCLDSVDFGLPTTYPSDRAAIEGHFATVLAWCLAQPADALLIECGGDILGANVPAFLQALVAARPDTKVVLVAADTLAALGAKSVLAGMGLAPMVLTGPCTDTPTIQARTQRLCGIPAINMAKGASLEAAFAPSP